MTSSFSHEERGLLPAARRIRAASGWLLGGAGWLAIALGLSTAQTTLWPVFGGALSVFFSVRAFRITLLTEWLCLGWGLALLPQEFRDWAWLGAFCCVLGRAMTHRWSQ